MRRFGTLALSLGALALMAAPALAQRPGGMMMGRMNSGMLLTHEGVQKELKLDDQQKEKIDAFATDMRERMREGFQGLQDLDPQERRERMQEVMQEMEKDAKKAVDDILKPEQKTRFEQIVLQARGIDALTDPEVQKKLELDEVQREKIGKLNEAMQESMREVFRNNQGDREAMMADMADLRRNTLTKVKALLTEQQQATWKEMTGEPFEVRFEGPRRRDA